MAETKQCKADLPEDGLTVAEALQVHAGWDAARKGHPFTQSQGQHWTEGWVNFWWLQDGSPERSWLRH